MASMEEIKAADKLTIFLERSGLALPNVLRRGVKNLIEEQGGTSKDVRSYIYNSMLFETGRAAPLMHNFIRASLELPVGARTPFSKPDTAALSVYSSETVKKILQTGALEPLNSAGGYVTKVVLKQVDRTQIALAPAEVWVRHTDSNACEWCMNQVSEYALTGEFNRHDNCRCVRVRK
jgi:hypothetical protein